MKGSKYKAIRSQHSIRNDLLYTEHLTHTLLKVKLGSTNHNAGKNRSPGTSQTSQFCFDTFGSFHSTANSLWVTVGVH